MTKTSTTDESMLLTEKAVANYLKDHPDFFLRHKRLLTALKIPHTERGAVSLVEIQMNRLRVRVGELEEEITQLMSVAISNEHLYRAIGKAHKALFTAKDEVAIHQILEKLGNALDLFVNLRFYDSPHCPLVKADVARIKASHFAGQRIYQGRLRKSDGEIFIEKAPELGSYLLLPIFIDQQELGYLSFASQDGGHFQPSMDTLFVEQLAQHVALSTFALKSSRCRK